MLNMFQNSLILEDIIETISEGNEAAREICQQIISKAHLVDPHDTHGALVFFALDDVGIYGANIVKLWDEVCGQDVLCMITLMRAYQLGLAGITKEKLNELMEFSGYIDIQCILEVVHRKPSAPNPVV